jgi:hypothetical protein
MGFDGMGRPDQDLAQTVIFFRERLLLLTASGRQDDPVTHVEPCDVLYFANEGSEAVSLRTLG